MGIMIKDAISEVVNDYKAKKLVDNDYSDDFKEAIITLVKIAIKYQKVQEIIDDRNSKPPLTTLNRIVKVVEDGETN